MKKQSFSIILGAAMTFIAATAGAEVLDRPTGMKIGQRMTLRPYVSFSATYDSNVSGSKNNQSDDVMWTINPGFGLDYRAESWSFLLSAYYNYRAYTKNEDQSRYNQHSYGETLRWNWSNSKGGEKGWALMLSEMFQQITMADDISLQNGNSYTADRRQLDVNAAVQRRFTEEWHSDINASYYWLDYLNDTSTSGSLYGWQRWTVGLEGGFAPSKWTDFLVALDYQGYKQDNTSTTVYSSNSQGFRAQIGIGSYATERISYRALFGWSRFEYADTGNAQNGFVYSLTGNWKIGETWQMMLLGTSYYQPSERETATISRVDAFSWGLTKSMIRGKLRGSLDLTYRHETQERNDYEYSLYDYALDVVSARLGFNYTLNRFLGLFLYGEYQRSWNDQSESSSGYGDYDRWRVTGGFRLTY